MDFVVVGFGLGALGVLLGVVMLGWLAPRSQQAAARVSSLDEAARHQALAAERHGTGQAFLYAGGTMLLATVAGLVGSLDDRTGAFLVTSTATVAAIGILLTGYLQRSRNPIPARRRTRSTPMASASIVTAPPAADTPSFLADEPPSVLNPAGAENGLREPPRDDFPATDSDEEAIIAEEMADAASWRPADQAANNGSDDTELAETEEAMDARSGAPVTHVTESPRSRPDDEDPTSGRS